MDFKQFLKDLSEKSCPGSGSVLGVMMTLSLGLFLKVGRKSNWENCDTLNKCLSKAYSVIEIDQNLFSDYLKNKNNQKICALGQEVDILISEIEGMISEGIKESMECDYEMASEILKLCKKYNQIHLQLNKCLRG